MPIEKLYVNKQNKKYVCKVLARLHTHSNIFMKMCVGPNRNANIDAEHIEMYEMFHVAHVSLLLLLHCAVSLFVFIPKHSGYMPFFLLLLNLAVCVFFFICVARQICCPQRIFRYFMCCATFSIVSRFVSVWLVIFYSFVGFPNSIDGIFLSPSLSWLIIVCLHICPSASKCNRRWLIDSIADYIFGEHLMTQSLRN